MNHHLTEVFDHFPGVPTAKVWTIKNRDRLFVSNYDPVLDVTLPDDMRCVFSIGLQKPISLILPVKMIDNVGEFEMTTFKLLYKFRV